MYTNCQLSNQEKCENSKGASVTAFGASAENTACKQAIIEFRNTAQSQKCGNNVDASHPGRPILSPCLVLSLALFFFSVEVYSSDLGIVLDF